MKMGCQQNRLQRETYTVRCSSLRMFLGPLSCATRPPMFYAVYWLPSEHADERCANPIRNQSEFDPIFSDFESSKIISDRIKLFCSRIGSDWNPISRREGRCIWSCLLVVLVTLHIQI